ncbi:EF-hand domain-containing protein [Prevotella histicola]|uniref:EF-hand domain-containing protein n=1 Tax=Prevotella histicola JCM 15637 = DNF00424 TaxID=1236504 RepID=A0AAW3FDW2_9BACT|nr:EF-hand domain-containing protein [Prevotella histicola]KGF24872.1 hypothetical protein HMPREF2132_11295 [Prevotella histicola JCM 15637 = DNF00424]
MILFEKLLSNVAKKPKFVHFDDPEVERIFLANFDKDGDGRISFEEAKLIKSVDNLFVGNREIKSLNSLAYTGITHFINNTVKGMVSLEEVVLPTSIEYIDWYTFGGFNNFEVPLLKRVVVLENKNTYIAEGFDNEIKEYVEYPANIKVFGFNVPSLTAKCTVIRAKNPPESHTGKSGNGKLYVPDESVQAYKEDKYFSIVADRIFPLSELNK